MVSLDRRPEPDPTEPHGAANVRAVFGDMVVHDTEIRCPLGTMPLRGSEWTVMDYTRPGYRLPVLAREVAGILVLIAIIVWGTSWAPVLLVAAVAILTSAWFSAPKGHIAVSVASGDRYYQVLIPALSGRTLAQVENRVIAVEEAAAAAPGS